MDINKYVIFLKILECRNFSKAANELGYTQSAVSHSVTSLEKTFGFKLFNRDAGNISLTKDGIDILPYIRQVVTDQNNLEFAISSYRNLENGTINIASIPSFAVHCFPGLLRAFSGKYPKVHISVSHGNYEEVEEILASGRVDFCFSTVTPDTPFNHKVLLRERLDVILPSGHSFSSKETLSLKDLESEHFIFPGEGPNHQVGQLIRDYDLKLNVVYSVSDDDLNLSMVAQNLGVTILPEMSYKNYLNFHFVARQAVENPFRDIGILYKSWNSISATNKIFIKFSLDYFKNYNKE